MSSQNSSVEKLESIEENCIDEIKLPNGLTVRFLNDSRKVAGDRWYVCLTVEIPIPVKIEYFARESRPEEDFKRFVEKFGNVYFFRYKKERNFIDEKDVEKLLEQLKEDFLKTNINYLKTKHFAEMCIRKALKDFKEQERIETLHREAIKHAESL